MSARPPEGTRDARLPLEDDAELPPPSSGAHRRPTMELGADVYQRATTPGVYPALARERAIRDAKAGPPPLRVPSSVRPPPASVRPPPASVRPAPAPASERPAPARLTEPLAAAFAPPGPVLPFEARGRSPSSPSTSFGPISAMTLQARTSRSSAGAALSLPPRASSPAVRASVAGLVIALGVVGLLALLTRRSAATGPAIEPVAAVVVATATASTPPSETASQVAPRATAVATARAPGGRPPSKSALPTDVTPPPAPASAATASSRARHRLFDTEN